MNRLSSLSQPTAQDPWFQNSLTRFSRPLQPSLLPDSPGCGPRAVAFLSAFAAALTTDKKRASFARLCDSMVTYRTQWFQGNTLVIRRIGALVERIVTKIS